MIMEYSGTQGGIRVSVTGAKGETTFTKDLIAAEIKRNVERWEKLSSINTLEVGINKREKGGRPEYTVTAEALGGGSFHADAEDWKLENAVHEVLERLDKEVIKKKERVKNRLGWFFRQANI
jgi:ribosome-associated translation inhibitor RaiA